MSPQLTILPTTTGDDSRGTRRPPGKSSMAELRAWSRGRTGSVQVAGSVGTKCKRNIRPDRTGPDRSGRV